MCQHTDRARLFHAVGNLARAQGDVERQREADRQVDEADGGDADQRPDEEPQVFGE
jgi:hypothetical protein